MLLSEAIRMGGLFGSQCKEIALRHMADGSIQTCALGGAVLASSGASNDKTDIWACDLTELCQRFPTLGSQLEARFVLRGSDVQRRKSRTLFSFIGYELNDDQELTRDQIADWIIANGYDCESVETVEQKPEPVEELVPVLAG